MNKSVDKIPVGRFAPSPSGRMHLGNIYAAYNSRKSVKERGGRWILRHEDLDRQRSRPEYIRLIEEDLLWLGLDWDEGGMEGKGEHGPYLQSLRDEIYLKALTKLIETGMVYPCSCRRADILAANAPHQSDGRVIYRGACRPEILPDPALTGKSAETLLELWKGKSLRLAVPDMDIVWTDKIAGQQRVNLAHDCGDFILRRADGGWAYQLAVVVDDGEMGVTEVMRGDDLLLSTAQQIYLQRLLGYPHPEYAHLPLLRNEAGQRLSKRDSSLSMDYLRASKSAEEILEMVDYFNPKCLRNQREA